MSSYVELLDAAILHLENLKARGARFVPVKESTLAALSLSASPAPVRAAAPATSARLVRPAPAPAPETEPHLEAAPAPVRDAPFTVQTLGRHEKETAMNELRARALECGKCPQLARSRRSVVFGTGSIHSELMFVGEAPGLDEDLKGEPFVGKAGQLLTRIIQTMGFRREDVYIANVLKCRPDTPGQQSGNRKPEKDEMKNCLPYLMSQIELIRPKVIVGLGATAMEGLLGRPVPITRVRGTFFEFRGIPVMATYHPSYVLRFDNVAVKREIWEDMLKVLERLGLPVTEKQRGYFSKGA